MRHDLTLKTLYRRIAFFVLLLASLPASAADYYWVGGSGNWSDYANHWATSSGGSSFYVQIPQSTDNVFFDANSFTAPGQTVTMNVGGVCTNMSWVGVTNTPTFTNSSGLTIYGSVTYVAGMNLNGGSHNFVSTATGRTITTGGKNLGNISFNGIGGGWTLQDNLTASVINLNNGSLNTNGKTVTLGYFWSYSGATRSLTTGGSVFNLSSGSYPYPWYITAAGITVSAAGSDFNLSGNGASFYGGGSAYRNLLFTSSSGAATINDGGNTFQNVSFASGAYLAGANTYHDVTINGNSSIYSSNTFNSLTLKQGFTYNIGGTQTLNALNASGTCTSLLNITGSGVATISSSNNINVSYASLKNILKGGTGTFTAINAIDQGGNTGWNITPLSGQTLYWVGGGGNWNDGNHWSLSSGGTALGCIPTLLDNVVFDASSFTAAGQTVSVNVPASFVNMSWTGVTNNPTFTNSSGLTIYGSVTYVAGMNLNGGSHNFVSTATGRTITTGGKNLGNISFNGIGGGWTLQDNLTASVINLNNGSLNTNGKTVTLGYFWSYSGATRSLTTGGSVFNLSSGSYPYPWYITAAGITVSAAGSDFNLSGNGASFYGGGSAYRNLLFTSSSGAATINDGGNTFQNVSFASGAYLAGANTYNDVTINGNSSIYSSNTFNSLTLKPGFTYTLNSGTTQTILAAFTGNGTGGFPLRLQSSSTGNFASIAKANGLVCADFVRMSGVRGTGGASFHAGPNSQDLGGNTGWIFAGPAQTPVATVSAPVQCTGSPVTFITNFTNGGISQSYNWFVNGVSQQNGTSNTYTRNANQTGDVVYVVFTSTATCAAPVVTNSNSLTLSLNTAPVVTASSNSPVAIGGTVNLNATGGANYAWTGPNSFASAQQMPAIANATTTEGGTYTVTATDANGCTGTASTTVQVTEPPAGALHFANGQRVTVNNSGLDLSNKSFSVEFRAKRIGSGTYDIIFSQGGTFSNNRTLFAGFRDNGNFSFGFYGNDLDVSGLSDADWHHWACTYDNITKIQKIYRDGALVGQRTSTSAFIGSGNTTLYIGDIAYLNNNFSGNIDELRVWTRALCQAEIQQNMNCEISGNENALGAYYPFNQGYINSNNTSVTSLLDASGHNRNGTFVNFSLTGSNTNFVAGNASGSCTVFAGVPAAAITSNSPVCAGNTLHLSADTVTGASYYWTGPNNFMSTAQHPSIANVTTAASGTYMLTVTNANGCSSTAVATVTIRTAPTASITAAGATSFCPGGSVVLNANTGTDLSYQWQLNGVNIDTATGASYTATVSGAYTVVVRAGDCSKTSNAISVTAVDNVMPTVVTKNITVNLDASGTATITAGQINNGSADNCGIANMVLNKTVFTCADIGTGSADAGMTYTGSVNQQVHSVGGGYNPNTNEYWYPEWAGKTIYRYNASRSFVGTIASPQAQMMQLWMDKGSNAYYTANWSYYTVTKISGSTIVWTYSTGGILPTGVTTDDNYVYVSTLGSSAIRVLNKATGAFVKNINLPGSIYTYGGLAYANGRLYLAGHAGGWSSMPNINTAIHIVNAGTGAYINSVSTASTVGSTVYNLAFDGETMWLGTTNNIVHGYKISSGNAYGGGSGAPVTLTVTDNSGNSATGTALVTVMDTIKPTITAPANKTINLVAGNCAATGITLGTAVTADNCGVKTVTNNAPASFPLGVTNVTWTVSDNNGNTNTAVQTVTVTTPEINASGNGNLGSTLPGNPVSRTFTIENSGSSALDISSIQVSGVHAADFTISGMSLPASIATGASNSFTVTFLSNTIGVKQATLTIANNDCNESSYAIDLTAEISCSVPVFTSCPAATTVNTANGQCSAVVAYATSVTGIPTPLLSYSFSGATTGNGSGTGSGMAFNTGVTNVVITAANACGNATCSFTVTVTDTEKPTITAPAAISVNNDAGKCGATINIGTATTADNCGVASVVNDHASDFYSVGSTTVTWTVTDVNGNVSTITQVITVTDTEQPTITAPAAISVNNDAGKCGATVSIGTATTADNCGVASVVNDYASEFYPVGTTTVTWTVTDVSGNVSTATQVITVTDAEQPAITAPAAISVNNDAGKCGATISIGTATTSDNCGVASVVNDHASDFYPVGTTTVIWTVTDVYGHTATTTQTITVMDTEIPVILAPANQVFCANTGGNTNYSIPVMTATDNCGVNSIAYAVTGATMRSGSGTDASGTFHIGVSAITWTVTDVHGNTSTSSITVTINPLPVASITAASPDAFCNSLMLTGNSTLAGPFGYQWLYNNTTAGTGEQLSLGLGNGDGAYSLYVTDGNGCRSELAATYTYQKQAVVSSYTILAYKEVEIGRYNKVATGSVGVMTAKGEAEFGKNSAVNGPGSFVKAPRIRKDGPGIDITNPIYGVATVTLPAMEYNTTSTKGLPNYNVSQNTTVTLSANYHHLTLKKGANVTLTGNTFGKIKLEEGASIRFTNSILNIEELKVEKGGKTGYTYVRFAPNTSARVSKDVSIGRGVVVNPDNHKVTFYMGDMKSDDEKFVVKGGDTKITANIYMPKGKLKVTAGDEDGGDDDDEDDDRNHAIHQPGNRSKDVYMTGLFIAEEVESKGNTVTWNSYNCSAGPVNVATGTQVIQSLTADSKMAHVDEAQELKITVMPNPSATYFTIRLQGRNNLPVQMKVVDASGRVVEAKANLQANSSVQAGHNYLSGTYFAEFIQGTQRKVVPLLKIRP